ncbi:MAG: methyltransferase domain-containing protein [Chloroflexi bacterium]|nr:methyltransferase domain-containing protein [Chloroflexota bacterium]
MVQYARIDSALYDHYTLGLAGDTRFYVEEARKSTGRVLELACGTGRITIPLAQAGINVVGIDLSPSMLAIAREARRAKRRGRKARQPRGGRYAQLLRRHTRRGEVWSCYDSLSLLLPHPYAGRPGAGTGPHSRQSH